MMGKVALAVWALLLVLVLRLVVTSVWWRLSDRAASPSGGRGGRRHRAQGDQQAPIVIRRGE